MLDVLGLSPTQEANYRALIRRSSATPAELADDVGVSESANELDLAELEQRGLINRVLAGDSLQATDPSLALRGALLSRQAELRQAEADVAELTNGYRSSWSMRGATDVIDVVLGHEAVAQRSLQLQQSADVEVLNLVKAPQVVAKGRFNEAQAQAMARGVHYKVIFEAPLVGESAYVLENSDAFLGGEDPRVVGTVPVKLLVADRKLALIPLADREGNQVVGGLLIHECGILDALVGLFDLLWHEATPLRAVRTEQAELDVMEQRIVSLLIGGLTDRAIASMLDVSERSVQRQVRSLMDRARARSRVQLGWYAARHNWLPDAEA